MNIARMIAVLLGSSIVACTQQPVRITSVEPETVALKRESVIKLHIDQTMPAESPGKRLHITHGGAFTEWSVPINDQSQLIVLPGSGTPTAYTTDRTVSELPGHRIKHLGADEIVLAGDPDTLVSRRGRSVTIRRASTDEQMPLDPAPLPDERLAINRSLYCQMTDNQLKISTPRGQLRKSYRIDTPPGQLVAGEKACFIAMGNSITRYPAGDQDDAHLQHTNHTIHSLQWHNGQLVTGHGASGFTLYAADTLSWLGSYNKHGYIIQSLAADQQVVTLDNRGTVTLFDISQPGTPLLTGELALGNAWQLVSFDGQKVLVRQRSRLSSINFSTRSTPPVSHLGVNLGGSRRGQIVGNLLYVADWFSGIHIYDIRQAHAPRLIGNFHTNGSPKGVLVEGNIAYVADDDHGLHVLDVGDPTQPARIGKLALDGLAYTMKKRGSLLFLAAHYGGFHIIDVSNPRKPRRIGGVNTPSKSWAVALKGNYLFVADDFTGILVFDISNPASPTLVSQFNPDGQAAEDIYIQGNTAYAAFFDGGLYVLDIRNPRKPQQIAHINTPGNARGIAVRNNTLYLASWEAGVHAIDIRQRTQPRLLGSFDTSGATWGVNVLQDTVIALDWWGGIKLIDFSVREKPRLLARYQAADSIAHIVLQGKYAYLAQGRLGLQIFDISNPLNPVWASGLETGLTALDIALGQNQAFIATGTQDIPVIDISQPFEPAYVKLLNSSIPASSIQTHGDRIIVWNRQAIEIITADKSSSSRLFKVSSEIQDVQATGHQIYVLTDHALFLAKSGLNGLLDQPLLRQGGQALHISDTQIYIGQQESVVIYDRTSLQKIGEQKLSHPVQAISADRSRLLVTTTNGELNIFSSEQPGLIRTARYPSGYRLSRIAVGKDALFFAGENRISSIRLLPELNVDSTEDAALLLHVPPSLPIGPYHILLDDQVYHNAFEVGFPRPKKPAFSMDDLKRIMQQKAFKGKAPQ